MNSPPWPPIRTSTSDDMLDPTLLPDPMSDFSSVPDSTQVGSLHKPTPPRVSMLDSGQQLLVMTTPQTTIIEFWQAIQQGAPITTLTASNANITPVVRQLSDWDLALPGQQLPFGRCSVLVRRTRRQGVLAESIALQEGGDNNDAPRLTGIKRLNVSGESRKTKLYAYHISAAFEAYTNSSPSLSENLLRSVARDKTTRPTTSRPRTIMHQCGNKWCVEGSHLVVGYKSYNDEQTSCHRGLQSATSLIDIEQIQTSYCRHTVKCWTVVYGGEYSKARAHQWE